MSERAFAKIEILILHEGFVIMGISWCWSVISHVCVGCKEGGGGWTEYMLHRFNLPCIVHTALFGISEVTPPPPPPSFIAGLKLL